MTDIISPGANIGVMGGGQLGRMFAIAARRMGYRVTVFSPEHNGPAAQFADSAVEADYCDEGRVREFAREADVVTFEFENIPVETVRWCEEEVTVRPTGRVLHTAQHRLREKTFLRDNGFPLPSFRAVNNASELGEALEQLGRDSILKTAAWGYDGKGQQAITSAPVEKLWETRGADELILEQKIDFEREISVIVARSASRNLKVFPVAENAHARHILDVTLVPARIESKTAEEGVELACAIAEKLDLIGILAVEMFVDKSGTVLVNELAPRPHNSGHWSIEGCVTSQFEQHVRAVCGLELGETDLLRPSAMANLLGDIWEQGEPEWAAALKIPAVHLHLYGKREPRPRRKMGHLTAVAPTLEVAERRVRMAREHLCKRRS